MKNRLFFLSLCLLFLSACAAKHITSSQTFMPPINKYYVCPSLAESKTQEEIYELSDLVIEVANPKFESVLRNDSNIQTMPDIWTLYSFNVTKTLKGPANITRAYLYGDVSEDAPVTTCLDNHMDPDKCYRLYLKEKDGNWYTTVQYGQDKYFPSSVIEIN